MRICFASHNQNKVKEMTQIIPNHFAIIGLNDLGIKKDIKEIGTSYEENSTIKAQYVFERYGISTFADDSGLSVKSLNGAPGVYSARYAGTHKNDDDNIDLLLKNLKNKSQRSAKFQTVITYLDEKGEKNQFTGEIHGNITYERKGENGFGYDPVFKPEGYEKTFAELSSEVKNKISHRAKAIRQLVEHLNQTHG